MTAQRNDDILLLIGRLNYVWTNTESLLIYLMAFLMKTSKEVAIVTFLTLNTTRARLDLIERLAKIGGHPDSLGKELSSIVTRMKSALKTRNKYSHCIYSFDENGVIEATQMLRIADYNDEVRYGKSEALDTGEIEKISQTVKGISLINRDIFLFLENNGIDY